MLFYEPAFFVFFAAYFALHVFLPPRFRLYLVIVGSAVFYAWWRVEYVGLPVALALLTWFGSAWVQSSPATTVRRRRLFVIITLLLLPLIVAKYSYFIADSVIGIWFDLRVFSDVEKQKWLLPLGISFITFTLIAFLVDIYRNQYKAETNFTTVLGYVLFFPHLIAGPILRPHQLIPQLK